MTQEQKQQIKEVYQELLQINIRARDMTYVEIQERTHKAMTVLEELTKKG